MSPGTLLKVEFIKASRRRAFVATTLLFAAMVLTIDAVVWFQGRSLPDGPALGLPGAWTWIMGEQAQMSGIFLAVVVVLIVPAEFSWRTARQNVIDGMSRNEWFLSKVLLIAALCVLYGSIVIGLGLLFGAQGPFVEFIRLVDVWRMGAYGLSMLGFTSMALMIALLIRSPGPAVAVLLFWILMFESMLGFVVERFRPDWEQVVSFLPIGLFMRLFKPVAWYSESYADAVRAALQHDTTPPDPVAIAPMLATAGAYVLCFLLIGYVNYSRRDL